MIRYYLNALSLDRRHGLYRLRMRCGDAKAETQTDANLGHIMSAFSAAVKELHAQLTGTTALRTTEMRAGTITIDHYRIDPLILAPFRWELIMRSGRYEYRARVDRDLEHVLLAFQGAMKFFAFKYGITTLDDEVVRNRDRAGEHGFLTKEDFGHAHD